MAKMKDDATQIEESNVAVAEEVVIDDSDPQAYRDKLKKSITVDVEDVGVLRKKLTISVPPDCLREELDKQYKDLIKDSVIPGFRRGRAPRRLVEKRFGSEVGQQVQTKVVSNAYLAAVEREDLKVLGDPLVWARVKDRKAKPDDAMPEKLVDMPTALENLKLPEDGALTFRCEVEMKPEFELPKLDKIPIERPKLEISEEDIDVEINRQRANRGHWAPVADGTVQADDWLVCDVKVFADGQEIKSHENLQVSARPQVIDGVVLQELGTAITGAKAGESRKVSGMFPDDYERADLRGKPADVEIKILDIKRLQMPEVDQSFAESIGFDSVDAYRAWIKEAMDGALERTIRDGMRNQIRRYLLEQTKLDLPEGLSSRQTERAVQRRIIELRKGGIPDGEIEKHADELRTQAREETANELKLYFVLERIAEEMKIEVREDEINAMIASIAQRYNRRFDRVRDELARGDGIELLYLQIRDEKCVDNLLDDAEVTEAKVAPKGGKKKVASKKVAAADSGEDSADTKPHAGAGEEEAAAPAKKTTRKKSAKGTSKSDDAS